MKIKENRKQLIEKYLNQEVVLPTQVRIMMGKLSDRGIDIYALSDLNRELKLTEEWLILSGEEVFVIEKIGKGKNYKLKNHFELKRLARVKEQRSMSYNSLIFIEADDLIPLGIVRFTLRQAVMLGHIKYVLESKLKDSEFCFKDEFDADEEYAQAILKPVVDAQNSVTGESAKTLKRLLSYLLPYRREMTLGTLGATFTTIVSLVPAYISGRMIDKIVQPFQDGQLGADEALKMAWILVAGLGSTYLLREFFIWIRLNKMSVLGEKVARDLRTELFSHLQKLSLDFYSKKSTGSIISRVSSDTDRIWDFVAFGVVEVGIALMSLIGLSIVLISMDWKLGLLMTLPVPFLLGSIYLHGERMKKMFLKAWRKWADLTSVLSDTIPGMQVVKAFNQESREEKRFNKRNQIVTEEFNNIHQAWTRFWPILMMGIQLIILGVWIFAIPRLMSTEGTPGHLSAGTFISFLLYMTMFSQPIEVIGQVARMLNRALSSAYRIFEILDSNPTITEKEAPISLEKVKGDVEFKNVHFSYDGVRHILKDLSFNVKAGEMIGLVGSSGGGKSTITRLIARFYDVDSGEIKIDGHALRDLELGGFRRQVGMVLQEPYLFHGSIWENISYGLEEVDRSKIIHAAKVANAHDFIGKLSQGYDTVVGERGHTLSGGERQRVSIARAILHDPRILILDEATSAVDTETERNIQEALDRLIEGRTVFAVAHRLSTLRKADRIFVIGKGSILEQGSHAELLNKENGEYAKLHKMQQEMSEQFAL
jgi:ATP-binding cassette, subfamily B, bacterial